MLLCSSSLFVLVSICLNNWSTLWKACIIFAFKDFNSPQHLTSILINFVEPSFDETKGCLERIKTLNYHISLAFNRLDQTLRQLEVKLNTEKDEHESTS